MPKRTAVSFVASIVLFGISRFVGSQIEGPAGQVAAAVIVVIAGVIFLVSAKAVPKPGLLRWSLLIIGAVLLALFFPKSPFTTTAPFAALSVVVAAVAVAVLAHSFWIKGRSAERRP